jgi:flagellar hook assembly protein FlgD
MTTHTWFRFSLPAAERAGLQLLDVTGRVVRTLLEEQELPAGEHAALWDGKDGAGALAPAGLYFARLVTAAHTEVRQVARLR